VLRARRLRQRSDRTVSVNQAVADYSTVEEDHVWERDYDLGRVRNSQVHMMMTADAATINSAQINVT
jgi:hypothetical protein